MQTTVQPPAVKLVGSNGQISLGKQYAGRQVLVEEKESGVWLVRTATVIPDNERWLFEPKMAQGLARAMEWAEKNPVRSDNALDILDKAPVAEGKGEAA